MLTKMLDDRASFVREAAAQVLAQIGPEAKMAVPVLTKMLGNKDWKIRHRAVRALGKIGPEAKPAVPALTKMLNDKDWNIRYAVADALGKIGPEAKTAVPVLTEMLGDNEWNIRYAAAGALGKIGPAAAAAVPALAELLRDYDSEVSAAAFEALIGIGPDSKAAMPALIKSLKERDKRSNRALRCWRIWGRTQRRPFPISPSCCRTTISALMPSRRCVAWVPLPAKPCRRLVEFASTKHLWFQAESLGKSEKGSLPESVMVKEIVSWMNSNSDVERSVGKQLWNVLGPEDVHLIKPLVRSKDRSKRSIAVKKLCDLGHPAMSALVELLKDNDPEVRQTIREALGRMGPLAAEAVSALAEDLRDKDWHIRSATALTLGQIGPGAKPAVGQLTAALADMEGDVRVSAIEALGRIGPDAQAATAGLVERLRDERAPVRSAAARAWGTSVQARRRPCLNWRSCAATRKITCGRQPPRPWRRLQAMRAGDGKRQ